MAVTFDAVTYSFPRQERPAIADAHAHIEPGTFALLAGPSAGGKSTFLRLCNGLSPQFHGGKLSGTVTVMGREPSRIPARDMARVAGLVFQEPEAQGIADTVDDEIAFGMEQQGIPRAVMITRLERLLAQLGLESLRERRLSTLSGGERQRVAIAAVLAIEPPILLLDEPTSQLDPESALEVIATVERMRRERDLTVLVAEHRLERLLPAADLVVEVSGGVVRQMSPTEAAGVLLNAPPASRLCRALGIGPVPLDVDSALAAIAGAPGLRERIRVSIPEVRSPGGELLAVNGMTVSYGDVTVLSYASVSLGEGEIVALTGANGSGKTTLMRAICGLISSATGEVRFRRHTAPDGTAARTQFAAMVPQDPAIALYRDTVADELRESLRLRKLPADADAVRRALQRWRIEELAERHPRDLSVGQQQRVAIAAMLAHEPPVWLLDEPTRGADLATKTWLAERFREHAGAGGAVVVSTHDMESAAQYATRAIGLDSGHLAFDLSARKAFSACGPRPTQVARLVPGALTPSEVSLA